MAVQYIAWDGNTYEGQPPEGWYLGSDDRWWSPGTGPGPQEALGSPVASASPSMTAPPPPPPPEETVLALGTLPGDAAETPLWRMKRFLIPTALLALVVIGAAVSGLTTDQEGEDSALSTTTSPDNDVEAAPVTTAGTSGETTSTVEVTTTEDEDLERVGSRDNPVPLGSPIDLELDVLGDADGSEWTLTIDAPGSDITAAVLAENQFNEPPEDGFVFYGVPVTLTLKSASKEPLSTSFNISPEFFGPVTLGVYSAGSFDNYCGVIPDEFDSFKEVFVGGSVSGTICYVVAADDAASGILVTLDEIEGDRIFAAAQ